MGELTFTVTGMVCSGCSDTVRKVVTSLPAVSDAVVNYETGAATVTHDGTADAKAIYAAIRDAGFGVRGCVTDACKCSNCNCDPCTCC